MIGELVQHPEERRRAEESFDERMATWPRRETLPWISGIVVDAESHVWVEEYRPRFDPSPRNWGVFDAGGRWLGRVEMPSGFTPTEIGADYVLGLTRDRLGVEYVRRHPLRGGGR